MTTASPWCSPGYGISGIEGRRLRLTSLGRRHSKMSFRTRTAVRSIALPSPVASVGDASDDGIPMMSCVASLRLLLAGGTFVLFGSLPGVVQAQRATSYTPPAPDSIHAVAAEH